MHELGKKRGRVTTVHGGSGEGLHPGEGRRVKVLESRAEAKKESAAVDKGRQV